jgi:hypothetical protein
VPGVNKSLSNFEDPSLDTAAFECREYLKYGEAAAGHV